MNTPGKLCALNLFTRVPYQHKLAKILNCFVCSGYRSFLNSFLMNFLILHLNSFMGDMSEEQEKQLEVFRKYIKDNNITDHPQYDDYYLLRFLRARKFDMEKTILMFNNFMTWRKENDVDNILTVRYSSSFSNLYRTLSMRKQKRYSLYTLITITRLIRRADLFISSVWDN